MRRWVSDHARKRPARAVPSGWGVSLRILIAEPSYKRRDEYFNALQKWGYTVVFAKDGIEALTMLYHVAPRVLVLTPRLEKLEEAEVASIVKDRKSTRLNSSHIQKSRMPSSA